MSRSIRSQVAVIALAALVAVLTCACVAAVPQPAVASTNSKAHAAYMKKMRGLADSSGRDMYCFVDLTGDGVDEAVMENYAYGGSGCDLLIFTYKKGKVKRIYKEPEYGLQWIKYYKKTRSLVFYRSGHGGSLYWYAKYKQGKFVNVSSARGLKSGKAKKISWSSFRHV